jgi:hypothetical protein
LPTTTGQTTTRLPGLTDASNPSTYSFYLADLNQSVAGPDTLYVADDGAGALTKFSLVGGTWTSNGTIGTSTDAYRGLTGVTSGTTVTLYAVRKAGSSSPGGELVSLTDAGGYNGSFTGTPTVLVTAATNTAFRSVALTPVAPTPPGVTITLSGSSTDVTEGGATDTYTVVLNSQPTAGVVLNLSLGGAISTDQSTISFSTSNWNQPQTVTVSAVDNNIYEGPHTGTISYSTASSDPNYSGLTAGPITVNVTDNDQQPVVEFDAASKNFNENAGFGAGSLTVKRTSGALGNSVQVNYSFTDGTAVGGGLCDGATDFNNNTGSVTFSANQTEAYIPIYLCNDSNPESTESFTVTISGPTGGGALGVQSSSTANILDDDNSTMELAATSVQAAEDSTAQIIVTRSGSTTGASSVNYTTSDGTAVAGSCGQTGVDYVASFGTVNFGAGEISKTISVTLCGDMESENPAETISLTLSSPSGGTLGTNSSATIIVLDAASEFRSQTQLQYFQGGPAVSSAVDVAGYVGPVSGVRVTLYGVTTAAAETLDALLVSPNGTKFVVTSMVGGNNPLNGATLTFEDVATDYMPFGSAITSGKNYKPTTCTTPVTSFGSPAPDGPYLEPGCDGSTTGSPTFASAYGGVNPTGTWTLYVRDNTGRTTSVPNGVVGSTITGGWGLQFRAPTAAATSVSGRVRTSDGRGIANAIVTIEGGGLASPVTTVTGSFGMYRFEGIPAGQTYVVTVRAKRFVIETPSRVVSVTDDLAGVDFAAR